MMSPDEMDAHSRRYSTDAFKVLPLDSGRIAVLTMRSDLYAIVDDWEAAKAIGPTASRSVIKEVRVVRPTLAVDVEELL